MLLLASILGEVKPPVASKEEIDAAGGISIVGQNITVEQERCLVCLSDYECGEEIRTLSGCGHLFHKQCIDQVRLNPRPHSNLNPHPHITSQSSCSSVLLAAADV
jgi:RING-like zinc finger